MRTAGILVSLLTLLLCRPLPVAATETVCIQCHSGLDGALAKPVQDWPESVHAENGITCHSCHGGDPTDFALAMSPERGFFGVPAAEKIPDFCGRCHPGVLADYRDSAHGAALGAGGPHCVTCHGNHAVRRATLALINPSDCGRCHSYARAEQIRTAMAPTDSTIADLQGQVAGLHRLGFATRALDGELFAARNSFHRLFHTVDVGKVRLETATIAAQLNKVQQQIAVHKAELSRRKLWGGGIVALLLLIAGLALLLHREYAGEKEFTMSRQGRDAKGAVSPEPPSA